MKDVDKFTHVIMTRFNLATPGREFEIRNRHGWLAKRFELFERYCLPSVAAQSSQHFTWIVYFDKDTPKHFREKIEALRKIFPFIPYYTGLFSSEGWAKSVREVFGDPLTPLLLSTRLDNDDALALDFVERLHIAVKENSVMPGSYNFREGYIRTGHALFRFRHSSNPFFSWLEPWGDDSICAPSIHHMAIPQKGRVIQIGGMGAWLQVIHSTNVSNKIRGFRINPELLKNRFHNNAISDLSKVGTLQLGIENASLGCTRFVRDSILALRKPTRS